MEQLLIYWVEVFIRSGVLGLTAYLLTNVLFRDGELFGFVGRLTNRITTAYEDVMADPDNLEGFDWFIWKYTYCAKCLAGVVGLTLGLCLAQENYILILAYPALAMFTALLTAKILE